MESGLTFPVHSWHGGVLWSCAFRDSSRFCTWELCCLCRLCWRLPASGTQPVHVRHSSALNNTQKATCKFTGSWRN